jgi:TATA-box binding protein (TBP) (component of TFIID and TFIIIB)
MFETSRAFTQMFRQIGDTNKILQSFTPKRCTISTMTIQGKLNKGISVETIKSHHRNQLQQNGLRLQTNSKDFNNQVTVKSGNASIKIFTNGRVHCTGSQSLVFFIECMDRLCSTLSVTLQRAEIVMINLNFGCQRSIPLPILKDYLGVSYDPDCYSGVKGTVVQGDASATVMAFSTGSVIISGGSTPPAGLHAIYEHVCIMLDTIFRTHPDTNPPIVKPNTRARHVDRYEIQHGYSSRLTVFDLE